MFASLVMIYVFFMLHSGKVMDHIFIDLYVLNEPLLSGINAS